MEICVCRQYRQDRSNKNAVRTLARTAESVVVENGFSCDGIALRGSKRVRIENDSAVMNKIFVQYSIEDADSPYSECLRRTINYL
jgi:hypothetical protein